MELKITETVLRDGNQSLIATRLPLSRFEGILDAMDKAGYYSLECWGGATFDSCIRFLGEDPWERLRVIRRLAPNAKLQMLLRGKSLLGYRHYPDDVIRRFVYKAVENGIDIIRIFDALNDLGNISACVEETLRCGAHPSCAIAYTESPVHSIPGFVELAVRMEGIGAKSVCVKDMAGILSPIKSYELIKTLKERLSVPVVLHSHCSGGLAYMSYLKALEAGADVLDTAISSFSGGTSQPSTEVINSVAASYGYDCGLDTERLKTINAFFAPLMDEYHKDGTLSLKSLQTDPGVIYSQIPGGMYTNLIRQLADQGSSDKFDEIVRQIPAVRKDLGYPPLVTPLSQMVGTQAMMNVVTGSKYAHLCSEVISYLNGEYGSPPGEISAEVCAGAEACKQKSVQPPFSWEEVKERLADICGDDCDVLTCLMFPQAGENFVKGKNKAGDAGNKPVREGEKDEARLAQNVPQGKVSRGGIYSCPTDVEPDYDSFVDFETASESKAKDASYTVFAVLPGTVTKVFKTTGDDVTAGEPLLICESMKMENQILSPVAGRLAHVHIRIGDRVNMKERLVDIAV